MKTAEDRRGSAPLCLVRGYQPARINFERRCRGLRHIMCNLNVFYPVVTTKKEPAYLMIRLRSRRIDKPLVQFA